MSTLKPGYSKIAIYIIIISNVFILFKYKYWRDENRVIAWDVISYYAYLPATFIYNDISLDFIDNYKGEHKFIFWPSIAPNGKKVIKTSMGLSILYFPFFLMGHLTALLTNYDTGGFSVPYKFFLQFSSLFYLIIGLFFLRKVLLNYFSETATTIGLLLTFFATNLMYYSTFEATMAHSYNFSMFAAFIYLTIKWYKKPSIKYSVLLGLLSGLIVLTRPTNIIILLFFIFWDIYNVDSLKQRFSFVIKNINKILLMALMAFIIWIPQLLYWKMQTGHFVYFSYGNERFFFNDPQIINSLFSYRKGWLLYAPIMIFALIGILFLKIKAKSFFLPVLFFTILNIYIVSSWWCWWYGGSYGLRAFIDSYAILIFPLVAIIDYFYTKSKAKIIVLILTGIFLFHGIFQTMQYYYGAIHWDSMTKDAYWESFGKLHPTGNYKQFLNPPDYEKALKGERDVK
ncbi:MAG: hypothetical protein L3J74_14915 [Bacteroidales bacterium]|nr:hypothetical protein [Bacteroidales bacterium]